MIETDYINGDPKKIVKIVRITGNGALTANILQVFGSVRILEQYANLMAVTTLVNATGIYADTYDGTNAIDLTANGAVLSGCPAGSFFTKDKDSTEIYSVAKADQVRMNEVRNEAEVGTPFTITQKNGVDTFIRFHLTTTDNPVDFTMRVVFMFLGKSPDANLVFL